MAHTTFYKCTECGHEEVSSKSSLICPICKKRMFPQFYVTAVDLKKVAKRPSH
jgi:DNA-directed RNA polymerase subunit RPC12/RpoP